MIGNKVIKLSLNLEGNVKNILNNLNKSSKILSDSEKIIFSTYRDYLLSMS